MAKKKVLSFDDKKYDRSKQIYDILAQAFQDIKYDRNSCHGWDKVVADLDGVTFRLVGPNNLEISYHRYEVGTQETLIRGRGEGFKFIKEIEKELKRRFKEMTKRVLKIKKIKEDENVEKTSLLNAETSSQIGYGYGNRLYGRFLVRNSIVYDIDTEL